MTERKETRTKLGEIETDVISAVPSASVPVEKKPENPRSSWEEGTRTRSRI